MSAREIGLFPLAAVLVPGELMPLHIFEDRYRRLIGDCEQHGQEFALLFADDDGTRELGCTAELVEVTERFDDGRLNVVVRGGEVVQVVELTRGREYTTGRVEPAEDDLGAGDEAAAAIELYQRVAEPPPAASPTPPSPQTIRLVSYAIAARVDFPPAEKQRILEQRSERGRLMVIIELLARGLENLAAVAEIRDRAQTNGKVSPPGPKPERGSAVEHEALAAAARVAGGLGAAGADQHGVRAAEVQVQALEPVHALAPVLEELDLGRVEAALAVEPVALDVHARMLDRLGRAHAVVDRR